MLSRTLLNVGWRYLLRHPWQSVLMIVGITLGVAVMVAIDLANVSASQAFDLSTEAVAGRATHQIVGGPQGLDESVYVALRRAGLANDGIASAPIISDYVSSPQLGNRPVQLLGIDPFAEAPFRNYVTDGQNVPVAQLTAFLTQPGAVLLSRDVADRYGLEIGAPLELTVGGYQRAAFVAGMVQPTDNLSRRALDGMLLADISTAQELTGRIGKLDRIDLLVPEGGDALLARLQAILPETVTVQPVAARSGTIEQMTAAFRTNLTALSLLALVVGLFLIYNTMTFSVVQRRPLFGTLRCLGVTGNEVFILVLAEALVIGVIGAVLGVVLGVFMGQGAVRAVTQTINDLYFVVTVQGVAAPVSSLVKGAVLGVVATVLAAAPPAWEAASVPPRTALSRSGLESKAGQAVKAAALASLMLMATGVVLLALPVRGLVTSFAGTFAIIIGIGMQTPLVTKLLMDATTPVSSRLGGVLGRMAPRSVVNSLSRTAIAIAALMIAVSVTIGVSLMVGSFRYTVVAWLSQTVQGDVYISPPSATASSNTGIIDPAASTIVRGWPGVERVDSLRSVTVDSPDGPLQVAAVDNPSTGDERLFVASDGPPEAVWEAMQAGAVMVSEPFANRFNLPKSGGEVTLDTPGGPRTFPVAAIYYDYASSQGTVMMALPLYQSLWNDDAITALALRLAPGVDADQITRQLQDALANVQSLIVQPNQALRDEALVVFDRTFAITGALQLLATLVAFIGVLSALLSLMLDKQRELGILRAVGLTGRQLWRLVSLETGLMGAVAGLLAMPTGLVLALILIYIINRRSFGWTLQLQLSPEPFIQALIVAVVAALLAGIYPAYRMTRMATSDAMRFE
ncbi:MAG: FtsX-like permease family protein [Anaerolineales bacterium]|nr:FtsX-like permease family protein [Anaerolineae bacterium]MCB0230403.1 FtsX-like permease family protein [Anaerolineae bacterium]MCB9129611.1 FtsX-like permease family protein [Anaerolineales bacterium]MCO5245630.1 FtsX-like permease family protein [Anaerolineae bacterium]